MIPSSSPELRDDFRLMRAVCAIRAVWRKTVNHMRTVFGTVMGAAEMAELIPSNPVRKTRFPRRCVVKNKSAIVRKRFDSCWMLCPNRHPHWRVCLCSPDSGSENCSLCAGKTSIRSTEFCGTSDCLRRSFRRAQHTTQQADGPSGRKGHRDSGSSQTCCRESRCTRLRHKSGNGVRPAQPGQSLVQTDV